MGTEENLFINRLIFIHFQWFGALSLCIDSHTSPLQVGEFSMCQYYPGQELRGRMSGLSLAKWLVATPRYCHRVANKCSHSQMVTVTIEKVKENYGNMPCFTGIITIYNETTYLLFLIVENSASLYFSMELLQCANDCKKKFTLKLQKLNISHLLWVSILNVEKLEKM